MQSPGAITRRTDAPKRFLRGQNQKVFFMSRPRTSTELKLVSGTYRRDRSAPKTILTRLERMPKAPKRLSTEARKQWRRLAPAAKETGAMTASDLIAFELLCRTLATAIEAEEIIAEEGATITAGGGGRKAQCQAVRADFVPGA